MPQSFQLNLQYILSFLQYAPVRVTSTVSWPTASQLVAPSALHAFAAFAATQPAALLPAVPFQSAALTPVALLESYAFAAAQPAAHPHAVFSQFAVPAGEQLAVAQPAAPFQVVCAQFAAPTSTQPAA